MAKLNLREIADDIDELVLAFTYIDNPKAMDEFISDLFTEYELKAIAMRWKAIRMLYVSIPYVKITQSTGMSSATIARLSRCLNKRNNGFSELLQKML